MISPSLESQIKQIVESCDCELYDIEILKDNDALILRISISNKSGVTHEHCAKVSEIISPLLDVEDPIKSEYFLEVSSPGLERNLSKPNHFKLSVNDEIEITLSDKTKKRGILKSADDAGFYLNDEYFKYSDIKKARSVF